MDGLGPTPPLVQRFSVTAVSDGKPVYSGTIYVPVDAGTTVGDVKTAILTSLRDSSYIQFQYNNSAGVSEDEVVMPTGDAIPVRVVILGKSSAAASAVMSHLQGRAAESSKYAVRDRDVYSEGGRRRTRVTRTRSRSRSRSAKKPNAFVKLALKIRDAKGIAYKDALRRASAQWRK